MRALTILLALAAPVSAPVSASVAAQTPPAPVSPQRQPPATIVAEPAAMFIAACDANGDGRTTHDELTACVVRSFAAIDTAHAGSLGYIGYADWALRWLGDRNALPSPYEVDADNDNRITLVELQARFDSLFARFDVDKDGATTRAELLTIRAGAYPEDTGTKKGGRRRTPDAR